ncbi:hypothetical protein Sjap_004155 [Stephania japonica]|uniref:Uncharacterized protein n=1 Tax=Stephania japonica TaxID=461633 RepID=A0AAP0K1S2_9MAGN
MVLWEITLATAYFLGLKRTYRLALKLQRRLISPSRPKIRQFLYRSRLSGHTGGLIRRVCAYTKGRNLGNWILRGLHRAKPSAQIRPQPPIKPTTNSGNTGKHLASSSNRQSPKDTQKLNFSRFSLNFQDGRLRNLSRIARPTSFPTLANFMRPVTPASTTTQYRQLSSCVPYRLKPSYATANGLKGVFREDIAQWMQRN